ncbi:MAG: hypothetical protein PVH15_13225, partial [Syntrophobacterales bacterium]
DKTKLSRVNSYLTFFSLLNMIKSSPPICDLPSGESIRLPPTTPYAKTIRIFNIKNLVLGAKSDRIEHSAWRIAKKRVNGKW